MRRTAGFTLVELLVVIGVIALLVGILLPVLSSARTSGIDVVCRNNLRQLHVAQMGYAEDHGTFTDTNRSLLASRRWLWQLVPYVEPSLDRQSAFDEITAGARDMPDALWCPAEPRGELDFAYHTYGINSFIAMSPWSHKPTVAGSEVAPSDLVLHADKTLGGNDGERQFILTEDGRTVEVLDGGDGEVYGLVISQQHSSFGAFRHSRGDKPDRQAWDGDILTGTPGPGRDASGLNAVFLDGHVASVRRSQMWLTSPHWHPRVLDMDDFEFTRVITGPCCR